MNDYEQLKRLMKDTDYALGTNGQGETIIFQLGENGNGNYVKTITCQKNGWLRTNVFYENGDTEELFDH